MIYFKNRELYEDDTTVSLLNIADNLYNNEFTNYAKTHKDVKNFKDYCKLIITGKIEDLTTENTSTSNGQNKEAEKIKINVKGLSDKLKEDTIYNVSVGTYNQVYSTGTETTKPAFSTSSTSNSYKGIADNIDADIKGNIKNIKSNI